MRVKICGLTNSQDAIAAAQAGADYLGFIINYPKSPRNCTPENVKSIIAKIKCKGRRSASPKFVGVFVDQEEIPENIGLDILQFHGNESVEYCEKYKNDFEVWKAIICKDTKFCVSKINTYKDKVHKILLDSGKGSGQEIDIELLKQLDHIDVLAGGIGLDNIDNILKHVKPDIIDVNSKIEREPGLKDLQDLQDIIKKIKKS